MDDAQRLLGMQTDYGVDCTLPMDLESPDTISQLTQLIWI